MRRLCLALVCAVSLASPAAADDGLFGKPAVAEADLDSMRGGFVLPGGVNVSIAVLSSTSVNGTPILTTAFTAGDGSSALSVFGVSASGLTKIDIGQSGSADTDAGTITVQGAGNGSQVILSSPELNVRHLAGHAYGSIAANRANDVMINTTTDITLEIRNATAMNIGSTMFKVEALAIDSAARLVR